MLIISHRLCNRKEIKAFPKAVFMKMAYRNKLARKEQSEEKVKPGKTFEQIILQLSTQITYKFKH